MVLYDWQRGRIPWFSAPPFDSNKHYRDALELPEAKHMKLIEHYGTFNIVDGAMDRNGETDEDAESQHSENVSEVDSSTTRQTQKGQKEPNIHATVATYTSEQNCIKQKEERRKARSESAGKTFRIKETSNNNDDDDLWNRFLAAAKQ
ncbi:hypothetical protein TRSC58_01555 [Trypanosoma rangeli SC58]|uniref:Uncharacterized protein n=1 Tax=Trypanosoma rangeli SC58 TaxID=429131 RepID=A0A061JBR8_TRYRA|nr:hypothetical protein TRSC58_01555 [Trypanosoma rangeli SC58]